MAPSIRIMLPYFPTTDTVFFEGYIHYVQHDEIIIYITDFSLKLYDRVATNTSEDMIYGCYCDRLPKQYQSLHIKNNLVLEKLDTIRIKKLILNGKANNDTGNCIIMWYDHAIFRHSETINDSTDYFSKLQMLLKDDSHKNGYEPVIRSPRWLSSSMFGQHLLNYFNLINWLVSTLRREKRVSIKPGNLILAILTDITLGYLMMALLIQEKNNLSSMLLGVLEKLVNMLYSLLKWLMGAPAGLKLNNAFNKMLGKYFSYHIQLWWLFLDVSGEKLDTILQVYHYLGYFGFTFQAAIISDMICIATFHSYCIYVYAARLFNIQVAGLIALLRLFVGRKYNPLREGIDSCEYTNQELFVGTVAFTILLLLLPTTAMYYIVFTLFRLLSLGVQYILAKLIYLIQTLPLYVVTLWLTRSPRVAGNILLEVENNKEDFPLELKVKLFNKSLGELVNTFKPPVETPKHFDWTNVLSNICVGKQII